MEPAPTVQEIARILRSEGLLLVYGHYHPVFLQSAPLTEFYERWRKNLDELEYRTEKQSARKWPLSELYSAVVEHSAFGYTRKHYLHSRLTWKPTEIDGFFRAHAGVPFLNERGYSDADLMLDELTGMMQHLDAAVATPLHLTYSVFLAVKADITGQ